MRRSTLFVALLLTASLIPAHAETDLTAEDFLEGAGGACIAGGLIVGLAAFAAGPAAITAAAGGTVLFPASVTTSVPAFLGCGASAVVSLTFYGTEWIYEKLFAEEPYPLLYPLRDEFAAPPPPAR